MAKKSSDAKKDKGSKGAEKSPAVVDPNYRPRLLTLYKEEIRAALKEELSLGNVMQVPRIKKIVLNMGVGEGSRDVKVLEKAEEELKAISGQKPKRTLAKLSVAAFKVRKDMPVGCCVTLRGRLMFEFLERLIYVAIPRIRDFRGLSPRVFDGQGNYNFGIREHVIFTEVDHGDITQPVGMNITIVTDAADNAQGLALLKHFGMPFRDN
jgi:large subunit ribosomal protein L5